MGNETIIRCLGRAFFEARVGHWHALSYGTGHALIECDGIEIEDESQLLNAAKREYDNFLQYLKERYL